MDGQVIYCPCLRWKMGEYQALSQLHDSIKDLIVPIIEVAEIGYDFESGAEEKSIDQHLEKFPRRLHQKWGNRACFVDLRLCSQSDMADGRHPVTYCFDGLSAYNCDATPVTGVRRDARYQRAVRNLLRREPLSLCLRVGLAEAAASTIGAEVTEVLGRLGRQATESHLILDLGAPNYLPIEGFSKLVGDVVRRFPYLDDWRSLVLMGSSFPESMAELRRGINLVQRREWALYQAVSDLLGTEHRVPIFGDYAVNHPSIVQVDLRIVKPTASIRYAVKDAWLVVKGLNVRDHKFGQYGDLCRLLMSSELYEGASICEGDEFIVACASGGPTSNLTTWRRVGTSRHVARVVGDAATFSGSVVGSTLGP